MSKIKIELPSKEEASNTDVANYLVRKQLSYYKLKLEGESYLEASEVAAFDKIVDTMIKLEKFEKQQAQTGTGKTMTWPEIIEAILSNEELKELVRGALEE